MTIEQALEALATAEGQLAIDGVTPWTMARLRYLTQVLIETPEQFWDQYFELADPERIANGLRIIAELGENATHADLRFMIELEQKRIAALKAEPEERQ